MDVQTSITAAPTRIPRMRYTHQHPLHSFLFVQSKLVGARRAFVTLEKGLLTIRAETHLCGPPIASVLVCEAKHVTVDHAHRSLSLHIAPKLAITLQFRHDIALMRLWLVTLKRASQHQLHRFYKLRHCVSHGRHADVYAGIDRRTGCKVAIKIVSKLQRECAAQAELMRTMCHKNVVATYDIFETSHHLYVVMEYVENGTLLHSLAAEQRAVNELNARRIARQLFTAVAYLHDNDIIHRDLNAENVLVSAEGIVKIAGFGHATRIARSASTESTLCKLYRARAYLKQDAKLCKYGKPCDIFACGVLLYTVLCGRSRLSETSPRSVLRGVSSGDVSIAELDWHMMSREARRLVRSCLRIRAGKRPTAHEALRHPWLVMAEDRATARAEACTGFGRARGIGRSGALRAASLYASRTADEAFSRRAHSGSLQDLQRAADERREREKRSKCASIAVDCARNERNFT